MPNDYHGYPIAQGDSVAAWEHGKPFFATVKQIDSPRDGSGGQTVILVRDDGHTEVERPAYSVVGVVGDHELPDVDVTAVIDCRRHDSRAIVRLSGRAGLRPVAVGHESVDSRTNLLCTALKATPGVTDVAVVATLCNRQRNIVIYWGNGADRTAVSQRAWQTIHGVFPEIRLQRAFWQEETTSKEAQVPGHAAEPNNPSSSADPVDSIGAAVDAEDERNAVVLVTGDPLSGVTRSMFEAARARLSDARLIHTNVVDLHRIFSKPALVETLRNGEQYLVWLDDLSPADLNLLGDGLVEVVSQYARVLSSINTAALDRILADRSPVTGAARLAALEYATRIPVPFAMTDRDWAVLHRSYPTLERGPSIGVTVVGGDVLVSRYHAAAQENPDGQLLVQAAVDARRCGVHRGLSFDELKGLFRARISHERQSDLIADRFAAAFDWAIATPVNAGVGLLCAARAADGERWKVLSYAAAADDGFQGHKERTIPDLAWNAALKVLPAADAYAIGIGAHLRGRHDIVGPAFRHGAANSEESLTRTAAQTALRYFDGTAN